MTTMVKKDWNWVLVSAGSQGFDAGRCGPTYGNWEAPSNRAVQEVEPIIYPVRYHDTSRDQATRECDQDSAQMRSGALGLPGRNCGRDHAVTNSTNDTADDEQSVVVCRALHDCSYDHDETLDMVLASLNPSGSLWQRQQLTPQNVDDFRPQTSP